MAPRRDLLFLCVANSARSQLAEGWARSLAPEGLCVHSAGSEPGRLNPLAVRVMAEVGIDISGHRAKATSEIPSERIGTVVTLCAEEVCPAFPGEVRRLAWPTEDPAVETGDEREGLERFRRARDLIEEKIRELLRERG
jgi:thioredoxin type arsenate reductase